MAGINEHKKRLGSGAEAMNRDKPQQQIYRPGDGPLRKSKSDEPYQRSATDSGESQAHAGNRDTPKKQRKPEQQFYIPKPVAQARESAREDPEQFHGYSDVDRQGNGNGAPKSKRYSTRRREAMEQHDEWRDKARNTRQGSEPRGLSNGNWSRQRDTRSVDPTPVPGRNYNEKVQSKPPSGRRHSTIGLEEKRNKPNINNLAPRFQKKLLEKMNNQNPAPQQHNLDDNSWDGHSLTFQQGPMRNPSYHPMQNQSSAASGYHTLPSRGNRGRGRLQQEFNQPGDHYRSMTPDLCRSPCNSRPPTPPRGSSRPQTPVYEHPRHCNDNDRPRKANNSVQDRISKDFNNRRASENNSSRRGHRDRRRQDKGDFGRNNNRIDEETQVQANLPKTATVQNSTSAQPDCAATIDSPEYESSAFLLTTLNNTSFNWSEEVEQNCHLEQESDALTRSSSMASLQQDKIQQSTRKSKRRGRRNKSKQRNDSYNSNRRDSVTSTDTFKAPDSTRMRRRRNSRERSFERFSSRETSYDRSGNNNWRSEMRNAPLEEQLNTKKAGLIVLPNNLNRHTNVESRRTNPGQQKSLFDPNNPNKPILIKAHNQSSRKDNLQLQSNPMQIPVKDQFGNFIPLYYDETTDNFKMCHFPDLIQEIRQIDSELQNIIKTGNLLMYLDNVQLLRQRLRTNQEYLLRKDLKFCQTQNLEQHMWKILYYNIIELSRKAILNDANNKDKYKSFILYLISEGNQYYEGLLELLQDVYKFQLSHFLTNCNVESKKGLGYVGLALNSAQKIFICLGDLGRYKEQVNETSNYGKCRQWYIKAQEINPKNGKPYKRLALLADISRRKLDAVYFYMRSLISSNPVPSIRESLLALFHEIQKKYQHGENKRREERQERVRLQMMQKESEEGAAHNSLRRETWIRPDGGRRVHRTTQALKDNKDSDEEDLASLSHIELNKRFEITYLHVLGKLFNKINMETFHEAALQMLKELRTLLQHTPVPLPCNRLLQLLALNMFAIESTQLQDTHLLHNQSTYRSELQERALIVSLQMFNLILERCIVLLEDFVHHSEPQPLNVLSQDVSILLPAVKIWCDWMLCHSSVWNPPPSTQDLKVGASGDCWSRLATLMNLFVQLKKNNPELGLQTEPREGYDVVRLPEDSVLCGFAPITYQPSTLYYSSKDTDIEHAQFSLRVEKLLFFGTEFVCGLDPLVLKLEIEDGFREYVSVVCTSNSRDSPPTPQELDRNDVLLESFSEDEEDSAQKEDGVVVDVANAEIRDLLTRKVELERKDRSQELHLQRVKKILSQSVVSVHLEVRPKYLVPDTNCFVDHLEDIRTIAQSHSYVLMVPIVVLSELEGLAKGAKGPQPEQRKNVDPQHALKVADCAKQALDFLKGRHQSVKCITTSGSILTSAAFTTEDDSLVEGAVKNDDKILATCLGLCKNHKDQDSTDMLPVVGQGPRQLVREVVLLTEDRNLRVKAHARDVPVRELPDFLRWAGLGG